MTFPSLYPLKRAFISNFDSQLIIWLYVYFLFYKGKINFTCFIKNTKFTDSTDFSLSVNFIYYSFC